MHRALLLPREFPLEWDALDPRRLSGADRARHRRFAADPEFRSLVRAARERARVRALAEAPAFAWAR